MRWLGFGLLALAATILIALAWHQQAFTTDMFCYAPDRGSDWMNACSRDLGGKRSIAFWSALAFAVLGGVALWRSRRSAA